MNNLKSKIVILGLLVAMLSCLVLLSGCGEATLSEIYVGKDGMPKKVTYVEGQDLDLTGGVLTTVADDGTTNSVPLTADSVSVTGFDKTKLGKQTLTVTYNGKTTTFDVTVVSRFTAENYEQNYFVGDAFDKTKGKIKIYRDNGTSFYMNINDDAVQILSFDTSKAGKTTVSVQCTATDGNTYSGSFEVTVFEIAELEFKAPTKKVYSSHESFDFKGGYFTVKAGGGSSFSKYVNFTESMITGFDPAAVTEENLTTPVKQTVVFSYAGKQFEFPVDVYYSGVYYIESAIEALSVLDWTGEATPQIPATLGERALEALKQYYALPVLDQNLINSEKFETVVLPAAVYLHSLYLKEFERFSDVFVLTNSGFSISAKSYEAVAAARQALQNPDDPFNVYADLLRDVYDDYSEVSVNETTKLGSKIFVHTEEYHDSIIGSFSYMLELYDLLKVIPDQWTNEILAQNAQAIKDTVTKIETSGYGGHNNIQLYRLVSKWRTNNDLVEIIYSYYMYVEENGVETVKSSLWKTVPLPGVLGEWYMATAQASNLASSMKTYKDSTAYLYDVSVFMTYCEKAVELADAVKANTNPLYKEIYTLLGGDSAMENNVIGAEYGYLYHQTVALDSEKITALWNEYLEILNVFMTNSAVSVKEYGKDFEDILTALTALSPAEVYDFICSLHFLYNTSGGTTLMFDCREGVRSYFTYVLASYYSTVSDENSFAIFVKLLLAIENYALVEESPTALADFKALMEGIAADYENLSPAERTTFNKYYGTCYEKYLLIYNIETGKTTVGLGTYEATFNELKSLIEIFDEVFATINNAETPDSRKNELVPVLFAIYEKADSLRKEIIASNNKELIEAFGVLTYKIGEEDTTLDRKVCEMRKIFVTYLVHSYRTIDGQSYRAWQVYSESTVDAFVIESVYLIIQGYKQAPVENVGNVAQIMKDFYALDNDEKYTFLILGFVNTYYAGLQTYYAGVYDNADIVKALLEADLSYLVYETGATDENKADFIAKFEAFKALYDVLADKAAFEAQFEELYEALLAKYNALVPAQNS